MRGPLLIILPGGNGPNHYRGSLTFFQCATLYSDFSNLNLKKRLFTESIIEGCSFAYSILEEAKFNKIDLTETIFSEANLRSTDF